MQGIRRYYALLLGPGDKARLVKALDGETLLAEVDFPWHFDERHAFALEVAGNRLRASIDGRPHFAVVDTDRPLTGGGVALVIEEGCVDWGDVRVQPATDDSSPGLATPDGR